MPCGRKDNERFHQDEGPVHLNHGEVRLPRDGMHLLWLEVLLCQSPQDVGTTLHTSSQTPCRYFSTNLLLLGTAIFSRNSTAQPRTSSETSTLSFSLIRGGIYCLEETFHLGDMHQKSKQASPFHSTKLIPTPLSGNPYQFENLPCSKISRKSDMRHLTRHETILVTCI